MQVYYVIFETRPTNQEKYDESFYRNQLKKRNGKTRPCLYWRLNPKTQKPFKGACGHCLTHIITVKKGSDLKLYVTFDTFSAVHIFQ